MLHVQQRGFMKWTYEKSIKEFPKDKYKKDAQRHPAYHYVTCQAEISGIRWEEI